MNQELLMAGAMLAACVSVYALGRALLPKGVRVRIQPVRRSAAREAALDVCHSPIREATERLSQSTDRLLVVKAQLDEANAALKAENERNAAWLAEQRTTLVPFSRSTNGYALNFSQKNRNAFSRNRVTVPRSPSEPTR